MDFIFDPNLVLYLPLYGLDGASFMSRDAYGHLCTVTGAVWRPNGRYFDGTDDKIDCGNSSALSPTVALTLMAWIYPNVVDNSKQHSVICMFDSGAYYAKIGVTSSGNIQTNLYQDQTTSVDPSGGACSALEWTHIVGTFLPAASYSYKNGVAGSSGGTLTGLQDIDPICHIGREVVNGRTFDGLIGEAWIYNRALTPLEIQHNYLATKWRYK